MTRRLSAALLEIAERASICFPLVGAAAIGASRVHILRSLKKMLLEFIKRSWRSYLAGLVSFSLILAVLFTITSGGSSLEDVFVLTISFSRYYRDSCHPPHCHADRILGVEELQQHRKIHLSTAQATLIGFGAGSSRCTLHF